jgi:hypothetical protein
MGLFNLKRIKKSNRNAGHVMERVRNMRVASASECGGHGRQIWDGWLGKTARESGITMIKTDDPKPFRCQRFAEGYRPIDHLLAQPGDQQNRCAVLGSKAVVFD